MRKLLTFVTAIVLFASASFAQESPRLPRIQENIRNFNSAYRINKDGSVSAVELIEYQLPEQRHGIIREIPYTKTNEDGKIFDVVINVNSVTNESGQPYNFSTSKESGYLKIKIGDANSYVTGTKTYKIEYTLRGALTYFSDHDEFYWNITGNEWNYPIYNSSATVEIEDYNFDSSTRTKCFTGPKDSKQQNCDVRVNNNKVIVKANGLLTQKEGLTLVLGFPKGIVSVLEPKQSGNPFLMMLLSLGILVAGLIWFIFLPIKVLIKYLKERSNTTRKQKIVSAWFSPPTDQNKVPLRPAEVSALVSKSVSNKEITATIIDLAFRGYIKIKQVEDKVLFITKKDIELVKLKPFDDLNEYEKKLVDTLFGSKETVKIGDLKENTTVYNGLNSTKDMVLKKLQEKGMFIDDLKKYQDLYMVLGMLGFFTFNIILGLVAILLGRKSARRTDIGIEKYSEAMSLKNFLVSQDEKLDFQADKQMFFEKLLPYATAFGVEDVWIKKFEALNLSNPSWYDGNTRDLYALSTITHSLNSGVSTTSPTRSSSGFSSGFSGGGSSGGGGGGGGGGSW
jgi:uncharacterized membrane protein